MEQLLLEQLRLVGVELGMRGLQQLLELVLLALVVVLVVVRLGVGLGLALLV